MVHQNSLTFRDRMISYAQNGEDVLLRRVFPEPYQGFYIDVGASHPVEDSVTKHFYERGWRGINIEPGRHFERLCADRLEDVNLRLALSATEATVVFYECAAAPGLSTLSESLARCHERAGRKFTEQSIFATTLARVCARYVQRPIDFLSVDVEGCEREVLIGADWQRWRPRVVLIEATRPNTTIPSHQEWEPILLESGYLYATFDGLNRYYVRREDAELQSALRPPINTLDKFIRYEHVHEVEASRCMIEDVKRSAGAQIETLQHTINELRQVRTRELQASQDTMRGLRDTIERFQQTNERLQDRIRDLGERLAPYEILGPFSLGVAHRAHRLAVRMPRTAATLKRLLGASGTWVRNRSTS